ncbi:hypothetical protein BDV96DRAFT_497033 [Lophiotrema nucula]|uniref:Enoyl reductase (ER) domain-containing protein n=1 Tax=Lophiotrema nucula TaxID=690887 RepID=A0A6A5Z1P4_9PLEO|nr:hypothetical protein BDV96DRAFT_497033 [Lophiotrema nucula]
MASSLPETQKAILFNTTTKDTLSLTKTAPIPSSPSEHLIKVHSTAITNGELTWAPFVHWPTLHVPCYDVSGTILSSVLGSKFKVGDRVFGRVEAGREGTARQYATILPSEASLVPAGLGMRDAAGVPMSALTAWQGLFEQGQLSLAPFVNGAGEVENSDAAKGKKVLVLGASGGVGIFAVQLAKLSGAWVAGTASSRNQDFLEELGIDEFIDYTKTSVENWINGEEGRRFDLVLDCVGGASMLDGWSAVKSHTGVYISIAPGFREPEGGKPEGVRSKWFVMDSRGEELEGIGKFITKGLVKTCVDSVWKLEEYKEAFAKTASGHARGKVVLKIAADEE